MRKLLKKFILSFLAILIVFGSILPNFSQARAQDVNDSNNLWIHQWYGETNPFSWYAKVYDTNTSPSNEIFGERYTAAQVQWVVYGLFSMFLNLVPGNPALIVCLTQGDLNTCTQLFNTYQDAILKTFGIPVLTSSGASGHKENLALSIVDTIGRNPISGVAYFKDLSKKFTLVTPVEAQGVGYSIAGSSIIALWRVTRNLSFGLIIIAVIILAFMIMFRVKISPQVVISVQSAIPKLIITLILITFSYALAGLFVDLMYIVIGILATFISTGGLSNETAVNLFKDFTTGYSGVGLLYIYWFHFVYQAFLAIFKNGGAAVWGIFVLIFAIVSILAILWWTFKIVWMLVKNFAMILITIVIGPLEILLGSLTGTVGFGSWFKKLISYLAVYPVMILMFFLSFFFLNQGSGTAPGVSSGTPFQPIANLIGANSWDPPLSILTTHNNGSSNLIWILVSFFIFSEITKVADLVKTFISGKPFEYGSGIGEVGHGVSNVARYMPENVGAGAPGGVQTALNVVRMLASLIPK